MPCLRPSAECAQVRSASQLGHVQGHRHVDHVRSARLPVLWPHSAVAPSPLHAACTAVARRLPPPGPQLAPRTVCPAWATLGRAREPSTSRLASTRPASRACTKCSGCAPPRVLCPPSPPVAGRPRARPLRPPLPHALSRLPARAPRPTSHAPLSTSAGRNPYRNLFRILLVPHQQAAHPLRMGGHRCLCQCWL